MQKIAMVNASLFAAALCLLSACSSSQPPAGAGLFSASELVTKRYGITRWGSFQGPNWIVLTGYRADGAAVRGVEMSWFASTSTTPGYTRLRMRDGSGATLRRVVDGGQSGHLSIEQIAFLQVARGDLMRPNALLKSGVQMRQGLRRPGALVRGAQGQVGPLEVSPGSGPSQGPQCLAAWLDPEIAVHGIGCGASIATFETVAGAIEAMGTCTLWYLTMRHAEQICALENQASCSGNPPTCNFDPNATIAPAPQPACDEQCICANYGVYNGRPCLQSCVTDSCPAGQTCHWGSCGPPAPVDPPSKAELDASGTNVSCRGGSASVDPATGSVSCVASSDPRAPDRAPNDDDSGAAGVSSCAGADEACGGSTTCCVGECSAGSCPAADVNADLPTCKFSPDACTDDWECCGANEVCRGTCTVQP